MARCPRRRRDRPTGVRPVDRLRRRVRSRTLTTTDHASLESTTTSRARLVVIDAGMLCGWRRSTPSIEQLHQAVFHLLVVHPGLAVAVVGDPALKHALSTADQVLLDADIEIGALVMAPAGTIGGFQGFLARIVEQATEAGYEPVVITDRAIPNAPLGRVRIDSGRWMFELSGTPLDSGVVAAAAASRHRRPARRSR